MGWKRVAIALGLSSLAIGVVWGTVHAVSERRSRTALELAKEDLSAGRIAVARGRLTELVAQRPDWDEALYHLGVCEQARNRPAMRSRSSSVFPPAPLGLPGATSAARGSRWTAAGSSSARGCSERVRRRRDPTSPRLGGAWCSCSACRDASRKRTAGSKTVSMP